MRARPLACLALGLAALASWTACRGGGDASPAELRAQIQALVSERARLRARLGELLTRDPRLAGMPDQGLRLGVPTSLARTLIQHVLGGFVDQVTLRLAGIKLHKSGTIKRVVTVGSYDLSVVLDEVTGQLRTSEPEVAFGGNRVSLALPVRIASGRGDATIDFEWDGKNIGGAVCGDLQIHQTVSGRVVPASYPVSGSLEFEASAQRILARPRFPEIRVNLRVEPSEESWAALQRILDEKEGLCGFVLDKVDLRGSLQTLIAKGFDVRLPTEKIKPMAVPVGIAQTLTLRGQPIRVAVEVGQLAITEHMIWLGAEVRLGE